MVGIDRQRPRASHRRAFGVCVECVPIVGVWLQAADVDLNRVVGVGGRFDLALSDDVSQVRVARDRPAQTDRPMFVGRRTRPNDNAVGGGISARNPVAEKGHALVWRASRLGAGGSSQFPHA